jgi:hypothetical protein
MSLSNNARHERGERMRMFGWGFWSRGPAHSWVSLSATEFEIEWSKMHRMPRDGRALGAKRCSVCLATVVDCEDAQGEWCVILGGVGADMWTTWVAGMFFISMPFLNPAPNAMRKFSLFERLECRWRQLTDVDALLVWSELSDAPYPPGSDAWRCEDCNAIRLDTFETFGERMVFFRGIPGYCVSLQIAGFFVVWCEQPFGATPRPQRHLNRAA